MCGITGIINFKEKEISEQILEDMTNVIYHRGPDGKGIWINKNIGLGHRRLSIIDLSKLGRQPMESIDGNYIINYNGEIYNYLELKNELKDIGYEFRSSSDTEVLLYSLIHWGEEALLKLNGMFAFCFYNKREKTALLGRDRFGIKPLYYSVNQENFIFGSETKSIIKYPNFEKTLDFEAIKEYFTFQNIFSDKTFFKNIKLLRPGHTILLNIETGSIRINQYWDFKFQEPSNIKGIDFYIEELNSLMENSIKRQLIADVEVGSFLSGGIDSSSIVSLASKYCKRLKTFTLGFDLSSARGIELSFDERDTAKEIASIFNTEHFEMVLGSGNMEQSLIEVVNHCEEPRVGQSYPNYYASELASKKVKVVLAGTGGDELFGGYPWRYFSAYKNELKSSYIDDYYSYWQRLLSEKEIEDIFQPIWKEIKHVNTKDIFKKALNFSGDNKRNHNTIDLINNSLYLEAKTFLHGILTVEDKLSMANSLEVRLPFLDNEIVNFAMQCPMKYKLYDLTNLSNLDENIIGKKSNINSAYNNNGKKILRELSKKYIPERISKAKKMGFSSPDASWFKGESINFVKRNLLSKDSKIYNFLCRETVKKILNDHFSGSKNRRLIIWSLIYFEYWLRENI